MKHKVVMNVTADDNFIHHDERRNLQVFILAQESPRATLLSVHTHLCQNLLLAASLGLLVAPVLLKLLVNFTQVYAVFSLMEGRAVSMLAYQNNF